MDLKKTYSFPILGDERGSLTAIEQLSTIPFEIKRVYYVYGTTKDIARGFHAHKTLHQVAICITGSCRMVLDNGYEKEEVIMKSPLKGLDLPPLLWHEMHDFSSDCVLLVLASNYYDENDYIRNYKEFKRLTNQ